ncbi:MAG TPA: MlaD family protein [Puia sp.]|jgi:phospholipid/cholesterol/gamma-HCH transport system substrate-binding protein|nr:MlaD family protein [Puia sp.]
MPKEKNYKWKLGLFSVVLLALTIGAIYYIGKQRHKFGSVVTISAQFRSVSGLKTGSNVLVGGIEVGTVDDIALITDTTVAVSMVIQKGVEKFIKKDAKASIGSEGLMGDKVIILIPGTPDTQAVRNGDTLASLPPIETDEILASLKASADNAAVITENLADISYRISHGKGALGKLLRDTSLSANISATMRNLNSGSKKLDENMEAAQHNFLLRGFFKKKEREKKKKEEEAKKAIPPSGSSPGSSTPPGSHGN